MGGPPGADSCKSFVDDFPKHPDDYYSTTSCVNCHQDPPKIVSIDPVCDGYLPRPSPCTAEILWPEYLQKAIRNIEKYPWWISENFLTAKMSREETSLTPKKLDYNITLNLNPNSTIPIPGSDFYLFTSNNPMVTSQAMMIGQSPDLSLLFENQTLFSIQNVNAHTTQWWDPLTPRNQIQTVEIKDGRAVLTMAVGALNLFRSKQNPVFTELDITDKIIPNLPVAFHEETGKLVTASEFQVLSSNEKRQYHRLEVLYDISQSGKFPERTRIEDLWRLFEVSQIAAAKAKKSGMPAADLSKYNNLISSIGINFSLVPEELIDRNVYVRFRDSLNSNTFLLNLNTDGLKGIKDLRASASLDADEIFIPGVAHLDHTTAQFRMSLDPQGNTTVVLDNIQSEIKPIDYFKSSPRKLGWIEIKEGKIQDGALTTFQGVTFQPGVHLESHGLNDYSLQMNLKVNATVSLPLIGDVEISTPVLLQTSLKKVEVEKTDEWGHVTKSSEMKWVPHTTFIALPSLELKWGNFLIPYTARGDFIFTDMKNHAAGTLSPAPEDGFWAGFKPEMLFGMFEKGNWELSLPVPKDSAGFYDFDSFFKKPELNTALHFILKDKTQLHGSASLHTTLDANKTKYQVLFSLDQKDEMDLNLIEPWIKEADLSVTTQTDSSQSQKTDIDLKAAQIAIDPKLFNINFMPIYIHTPRLRASFSENQRENQLLDWTIHSLELTGNPWVKRQYRGLVQGPILLKTYNNPSRELTILIDSDAHQLDVKNLGLRFDFKGLALPGLWNMSGGNISSLDIDGRVHGWWRMDTDTYKGRGKVIFRGDKEGDIHFRDRKGRRIEARLNPDDPDRLYEIPLFADSTYTIDRVDGVDFNKERINGHFLLRTLIDFMVLRAVGVEWNQHSLLTFEYNHQPYTKRGFDRKIEEFFRDVAAEQKKAKEKQKGAAP